VSAPGIVLAWHRVRDAPVDPWGLCVSPSEFSRQVETLRAAIPVLDLVDLVERARSGRLHTRAVAITFDDGYVEMLRAADILDGLPATFFVPCEPRGAEYWWDTLARRLPDPAHRPLLDALHARLLAAPPAQRASVLAELPEVGPADPQDRTLLPDELRALAGRPGVAIGAHGLSHEALTALSEERRRDEVVLGGLRLAALTGKAPDRFAYPFGMLTEDAPALAREAGYRVAVTTRPGRVEAHTDPHLVPRLEVRPGTSPTDLLRAITPA
jgi:peptidoglycan/xylan/chitin deacetylase (PgdA/CDA1 family)